MSQKSWHDLWPIKSNDITTDQWRLLSEADRKIIGRLLYERQLANSGNKSHAKEVSRTPFLKLRKLGSVYSFSKDQLTYRPKEFPLADCFFKGRQKKWKIYPRRNQSRILEIEDFSFLDAPKKTIRTFCNLIKAECEDSRTVINFKDKQVLDVSSFLLLSILYRKLSRFSVGGIMEPSVQKVLNAVGLTRYMGIETGIDTNLNDVYAFPLRSLEAGTLRSENIATQTSRREKVQGDFTQCVNNWLGQIQPAFELTSHARSRLGDSIGEALDNAQRHSTSEQDGGWWITGFMARRYHESTTKPKFVCHFAIVNEGRTIGQSLLSSPRTNKNFWPLFDDYLKRHTNLTEELAATILAMQQGVSRNFSIVDGGQGFSDLIEYIAYLGNATDSSTARLAVISGNCMLRLENPYLELHIDGDNRRLQWFNSSQDWRESPDNNYVFNLPINFPGTIIAVRFELNGSYSDRITNRENGERNSY